MIKKTKSIFDARFTGDSYGGMSLDELDEYLHPQGHDAASARKRMIKNQSKKRDLTPSKALKTPEPKPAENEKWRHG